jgi:lipid-A-disaccharide synthase
MRPKTIYFVAGEASADNHGAALMRALRNLDVDLNFVGRGGPQMKARAGAEFDDWIDKAAVVGLWEVIKSYGYFRKQFREALSEIEKSRPDAVVLIDYPGFNLRLARALRRNIGFQPVRPTGVPPADSAAKAIGAGCANETSAFRGKIIYYISPQVWAWNRGRIKKMARWLDLMLCIFPFEAELYNQSGLRTVFVGHPMIERLRAHKIDSERDPNLIGLFPGSRRREVRKIFPILIKVARELRRQRPNVRFEIAAASHELTSEMERMFDRQVQDRTWHRHPADEIHGLEARATIEIKIGDAAALMQRASAGIVTSGSATLEAAHFRLPFVLVYKVSWLTYFAGRLLVKVKYLGMPNLLADKEVVPEFIQHRAKPRELANAISRLMDEPSVRQQMISEFDRIIRKLGEGEASAQAAKAIVDEIAR